MKKLCHDILEILEDDSRTSVDKIAAMLETPRDEVAACIASLEKTGILAKYTVLINYDKMDEERVEALIEVRVAPQQKLGFEAIAEEIYSLPNVRSVFLMSGAYDLAVTVAGKSLKSVALFISEKLSTMQFVLSTATHFILKRYKSEGVLLEGDENKPEKKRMAVMP